MSQKDGRSLGKLLSELAAEALAHRRARGQGATSPRLEWISKPMYPTFDWADTAALASILDRDDQERLVGHQAGTAAGPQ